MSTHAIIGMISEDNKVRSIYNDHDGYPSVVGDILLDHYNTPELINQLLDLGDISGIGLTLGECDAYGRDRGEEGVDAKIHDSVEEFLEKTKDQDYTYLFKNGKWHYRHWDKKLKLLTHKTPDDAD